MIKPLRHFITATPLGALMSLTPQHTSQYPSFSTSSSALLLCGVCYWSWVNKWVFQGKALKIDLLAQTICSCPTLNKWLSLHWSIVTAYHLKSTWFFFVFFLLPDSLNFGKFSEMVCTAMYLCRLWNFIFCNPDSVFCWFFLAFIYYYCYQKNTDFFFLSQTEALKGE